MAPETTAGPDRTRSPEEVVDAFIEDIRRDDKPDPENENQLVAQLKYIADVLRRLL
jgi:hypothetical protein